MRILPHGAMMALAAAAMCQQPVPSQPPAPTITIRMLNGKSGKPVAGDLSNVWLGNGKDQILKTDKNGEIRVSVEGVEPRTIRFLPNYYEDCRYKEGTPAGMDIPVLIDEILTRGVVAENHCGKQHLVAQPGVLVIYVRDFKMANVRGFTLTKLEIQHSFPLPTTCKCNLRTFNCQKSFV